MLVQIATSIVVVLGMLGLVIDFGVGALERRHLQNAAEAAALSGAYALVQAAPTTDGGVTTVAAGNGVSQGIDGRGLTCRYVDPSNTDTGPCSGLPASDADGVRVTATRLRETYFMRVLGIQTMAISAIATARVSTWTNYNASASLFVVCGYQTRLAGGGNLDILQGDPISGPWTVNPAALGKTFAIHDASAATCGAGGNMKGRNGEAGWVTLPREIAFDEGNAAGPTGVGVAGPRGCGVVTINTADDCVMVVPVATTKPASAKKLYAVTWLPFLIRKIDANTHTGQLLASNWNLSLDSATLLRPWKAGSPTSLPDGSIVLNSPTSGPTSVRMTD